MNRELERLIKEDIRYKPFAGFYEKGYFDGIDIVNTNGSRESVMFEGPTECALKYAFGIDHPSFGKYIEQATKHKKLELRRMATLHSSSLLPMLYFHGADDDNPVILPDGKDGRRAFRTIEFEKRNNLSIPKDTGVEIRKDHPSHIDVMFRSIDGGITLFLESKYSEYLTNGKCSSISREAYYEQYERLKDALKNIGLTYDDYGSSFMNLQGHSGKTKHYAGGIKQMISHWMGAITYANEHRNETVLLGEIVFDFGDEGEEALKKYKKDYQCLAEGLSGLEGRPANLQVFTELMTYQEINKWNNKYAVSERIRAYYGLDGRIL